MARLQPLPLPIGISERQVEANGLSVHILEAGRDPQRQRPLLLLLHGYPELAFSWRKIIPGLANAGYYVVAPDTRGYGRTVGWDTRSFHEVDMSTFTLQTIVRDNLALVSALGYRSVHCVIGHDFGAVAAAMCALMRPDFFRALVTMSHPFKAPKGFPFNTANEPAQQQKAVPDIEVELAKLNRKHYKWYNSTDAAAADWANPPQGMHAFLRGYWHLKSADWKINEPHPLETWDADQLAKMPEYYVLQLDHTMPQAIAANMEGEDPSVTESWLSPEALDVYASEWTRTGFQGALNSYRNQSGHNSANDEGVLLFAGKKIEVPAIFVSGAKDWGNYQEPGAIETLGESCTQFKGTVFIDGAGHWPQQEQPEKVLEALLEFVKFLLISQMIFTISRNNPAG